eukprot:Lankesteria_metandrocarpae@DN5447_c1_g1_i5.p1
MLRVACLFLLAIILAQAPKSPVRRSSSGRLPPLSEFTSDFWCTSFWKSHEKLDVYTFSVQTTDKIKNIDSDIFYFHPPGVRAEAVLYKLLPSPASMGDRINIYGLVHTVDRMTLNFYQELAEEDKYRVNRFMEYVDHKKETSQHSDVACSNGCILQLPQNFKHTHGFDLYLNKVHVHSSPQMLYNKGTNKMLATDHGTRFWSRTSPSTVHEIPHYRVTLLEECRRLNSEIEIEFAYLKGNYLKVRSQRFFVPYDHSTPYTLELKYCENRMEPLMYRWLVQKLDAISIAQFDHYGVVLEYSLTGRNENMECYKIEHVRN